MLSGRFPWTGYLSLPTWRIATATAINIITIVINIRAEKKSQTFQLMQLIPSFVCLRWTDNPGRISYIMLTWKESIQCCVCVPQCQGISLIIPNSYNKNKWREVGELGDFVLLKWGIASAGRCREPPSSCKIHESEHSRCSRVCFT